MKKTAIPILDPNDVLSGRVSGRVPRHDLHLHTDFTDGRSTLRDYVERAIELGLEHIGFPEHCNLSTAWLPRFAPAVDEERRRIAGRVHVHWGIEAKGMDKQGTLAAKPEMIEAAEYIFGAFHSSQTKTPFPKLGKDEAIEMEFQVISGLIERRSCHAVAHPGGLCTKYHGSFDDALFDRLAEAASRNDVALELNPGYGADVGKQLATCRKYGTRVVLGSNAHAVDELGLVVRAFEDLRPASGE